MAYSAEVRVPSMKLEAYERYDADLKVKTTHRKRPAQREASTNHEVPPLSRLRGLLR